MNKPTPDTGSMPGTALDTMGNVLGSDLGRDAIHLAAIAVTSDERLFAGQHVGLVGEKKVSQAASQLIGIVDPFLPGPGPVFPGQHFWLVLYPRTITSLRHVWTHPAFEGADGSEVSPVVTTEKAEIAKESEAWLRNWLISNDGPSYEAVMSTIKGEARATGYMEEEFISVGYTASTIDIPPEFWTHVESVLGHPPRAKPSYFSCSC